MSLPYRTLIYAFIYEFEKIWDLFCNTSKYKALLNSIKKYRKSSVSEIYQKDLIKELGIQRVELNNLLNELYAEFQNTFINEKAYEIKNTVIWLLPGQGMNGWPISVEELAFLPRIGETVFLPSLTRNHVGASYFKVHEIIHQIEAGVHTIEIHMNGRRKSDI